MGRKRASVIIATGLVGIAAIVFAAVHAGHASSEADAANAAATAVQAPTSAFSVRSVGLPAGWRIQSASSEYLNLQSSGGCFTTSALIVTGDYNDIASVGAFESSYVPRFQAQGYQVSAVAPHDLMLNESGSVTTVTAVYYKLERDGQTTYHVDGGIRGRANTAFDGLSCGDRDALTGAQQALLGLTYNDAYVPLSGSKQ